MGTGEQTQNKALTTDGDMENHQQRYNINRQEKHWKQILSGGNIARISHLICGATTITTEEIKWNRKL
jgi:hypothetical protein